MDSYLLERMEFSDALYLRATQTHSSRIAEQQAAQKKAETFSERVPEAYHDFKDVFDKDEFD